jgi:hypothetical protein
MTMFNSKKKIKDAAAQEFLEMQTICELNDFKRMAEEELKKINKKLESEYDRIDSYRQDMDAMNRNVEYLYDKLGLMVGATEKAKKSGK